MPFIKKLLLYHLKSAENQSEERRQMINDSFAFLLLEIPFFASLTDVLKIMNLQENNARQWTAKTVF